MNLSHILCKEGCSGNDHVFSRETIEWDYLFLPKKHFRSDHGRIEIQITGKIDIVSEEKIARYAFSVLSDPTLRDIIRRDWILVAPMLTEVISKAHMNIHLYSTTLRSQLQHIVDIVYDLFVNEIISICDRHLPKYDAQQIKSSVDRTVLDGEIRNKDVIRLFKRKQRAKAAATSIKSRDKSKTPMQETYLHYSRVFKGAQDQIMTITQINLSDDINKFEPSELSTVIQKYSTSKSGGIDGLHTILFKCLNDHESFSATLCCLYNLFYSTSVTPSAWNQSMIHLLIKDPAEPFADKTRPISLTNILRRFYEKLLFKEWKTQAWTELHNSQAGFRDGWSVMSNILLSDTLSKLGYNISIFLDLKAAFDEVPHCTLMNILAQRKCPLHYQNQIFSLMMNECSSLLSVNQSKCKTHIQRDKGLFQGSILSPLLFNIFIDTLAIQLATQTPSVQILLFADDIELKTRNTIDAQASLDVCQEWAVNHKQKWGIHKCGVTYAHENNGQPLKLGDEIIPVVEVYQYLGLPHRSFGIDWRAYLTQITSQTRSLINALLTKRSNWNYNTRLLIYKVFIRSKFEYCLPLLWTWIKKAAPKLMKELEDLHLRGLEFIFNTKRSKAVLENLSGLGSLSQRALVLQASLSNHLRKLSQSNPLTQLYSRHFLIAHKDVILMESKKSLYLDEFNKQSKDKFSYSWRGFNRYKLRSTFDDNESKLTQYVSVRSRRSNLMDSILLEPLSTSSKALLWRTNRAFVGRICPACSCKFNRRHINSCKLYAGFQGASELMDSDAFTQDFSIISEKYPNENHYCLMDFLLNEKDYHRFILFFDHIQGLLLDKSDHTFSPQGFLKAIGPGDSSPG
jgi:hypothetical protein